MIKQMEKMKEQIFKETASAKMLEFDKIVNKLETLACTKRAKEEIQRLQPSLSEAEVKARLRETTEAVMMLEKCGNPPISMPEEIDEFIDLASKGGCLSAEQLEQTERALTAVRRLKNYLCRGKGYDIGLSWYEENLNSLDEIRKELADKIRGGKVDDYASKLLKELRSGIEKLESKMREKAEGVIRANKDCMSDSFSTIRNGRICIPVRRDCRSRISGSVIDKSATGSTLFMEPAAVTQIAEKLQEMRIDEENEERRILYTLSEMLSDKAQIIYDNNKTIEKLDYIFARGKLSMEYDGVMPQINTGHYIKLTDGRHPLMEKSSNVPLQFEIGQGINGVIITGPNTGGKTVAIKTVALSCMMAQCGLHVACGEAWICMNDQILCDIGDGQNISENLSTFSAHITNVLDILKKAGRESLVILDELGSGTDPAEGMGIAVAILKELKKSGALYLVTTHYPEVKNYADKEEGVINARMTFDRESLRPLYQLVIGEAGESCAFYIAQKLGMPEHMLAQASAAAYGQEIEIPREEGAHKEGKSRILRMQKQKTGAGADYLADKFRLGDSVMIYPDRKIGIICEPVNEKGVVRVQMPDKKIYINHKRVKLHVAAEQLYPADYDFSIIFDTVENRKARHRMERKYEDGLTIEYKE